MENPRDTNPPPTPSTPSHPLFPQQQQQQQQQTPITPSTPSSFTPITPITPNTPSTPDTSTTNNLPPAFSQKLTQLRLPLAPLVRLTTGTVHPRFPPTLLHFWLLTDAELDSLATFYHQRAPTCAWTTRYPCPVAWPRTGLGIEDKRRKMGRFIGLRGCESPVGNVEGGAAGRWVGSPEEAARRDREGGGKGGFY